MRHTTTHVARGLRPYWALYTIALRALAQAGQFVEIERHDLSARRGK